METKPDIFKNYLIEEFVEDFMEQRINRRDALKHLAVLTGSIAAATSLLAGCATPNAASLPTEPTPPQVDPGDDSIVTETPAIPLSGFTLQGYLARPDTQGQSAAVLVCHENRGLTDHIKDVTRRLAKAGYVAFAVDLLSREGGTDGFSDSAQITEILGTDENKPRFVADFQAGFNYLKERPDVLGDRIGMVGFCFGGGVTWLIATKTPELKAAVVFYGPNPPIEDVDDIQAPVLAHYGSLDERINGGIPAIETAMTQNGKVFEKVIYEGANHAFHNDTGERYHKEHAQDAWARTLAWFERHLRS